jgi:amino acid transporter
MPVFAGLSAFGQFGEVGGRLFAWLLLLFGVCWVANDIPPFILTSSRLIFAMGFDRILPEKLADVDERWHSPVNAVIVTSIVALVGVVSEADLFGGAAAGPGRLNIPALVPFFSSGGAVTATDIWDILFFAGMGLACALFPMRKKDVFDRSLYAKNATLVQVMGWLAFLVNIWVGYILIFDPHAYGFMGTLRSGDLKAILTSGTMVTIYLVIICILLYYWGRSRAKSVGADLTTIYAEIPPE